MANEKHWIVLEMPEAGNIQKIRVYVGDTDRSNWVDVDIYVSEDVSEDPFDHLDDWGRAVKANVNITDTNWVLVDVDDKDGRYIWLKNISTQHEDDYLRGYEIEVLISPAAATSTNSMTSTEAASRPPGVTSFMAGLAHPTPRPQTMYERTGIFLPLYWKEWGGLKRFRP